MNNQQSSLMKIISQQVIVTAFEKERTPSTALYCKVTYIPMVSAADESMARTKVKSSTMNFISCFLEESERSSSTLPA